MSTIKSHHEVENTIFLYLYLLSLSTELFVKTMYQRHFVDTLQLF